jgi:hypothetical protein
MSNLKTIPGYDNWKLAHPKHWETEEDEPQEEGDQRFDQSRDDALTDATD